MQNDTTRADSVVAMEITPLGDSALIIRVGDSLAEVLATTRKLEGAAIEGVSDIAPAFASVAIFFDGARDLATCVAEVRQVLTTKARFQSKTSKPNKARLHRVPVCYDPEFALDLAAVAEHCRLSPNELVKRHAAAEYRVRCLGFTPGFPYLSGLPRILATPRRPTPRISVPAGSVAIGGAQAGIYPLSSPGGWNVIGRTPLRLFDAKREPAALLRAGDRLRFITINRDQFQQWPA
ncbi:MAG: 5-oxoprolinase subunit PxpB [Chthoniobacterales bacterium]